MGRICRQRKLNKNLTFLSLNVSYFVYAVFKVMRISTELI
ncbi:MAG: hypothetical protein ACI9U5_000469, partial [Colwellia sp.]